jgi:hypothetical protein
LAAVEETIFTVSKSAEDVNKLREKQLAPKFKKKILI